MRIRVSDPNLLHGLLDFLRRAGCVAEQARRDEADVFVPRAPDEAQAQREVELYLQTWLAMSPRAGAEIVAAPSRMDALPKF